MPSLSVCMIVRNEAEQLPRCLENLRGIAEEVIVVDTGSTDGTLDIARLYGAVCDTIPWQDDFAHARNVSLSYATRDYILVLDADEVLYPDAVTELHACLQDVPQAAGFLVHIMNETDGDGVQDMEESVSVRLFRNCPQYRFQGALHEQIAESILYANPPGKIFDSRIRVQHRGYTQSLVMLQGKQQRNLSLAEAEVAAHPDDAFRTYNLGVEYLRSNRLGDAVAVLAKTRQVINPEALWTSRFYKVYVSALMRHGDWGAAEQELKHALFLFPDYTDLHYLLGVLLDQKQEWAAALATFARCIQMGNPPVPPYTVEHGLAGYRAYFALGQVFQELGKTGEAVVAYRESFTQNPSFTQAYLRFASLLLADSTDSDTLTYVSQVATVAGDRQGELLGSALALAGQFELAREWLEPATRTDAGVLYLALTYACTGEVEKLRQLLAQRDSDGQIRQQVRQYLVQQGLEIVQQGLQRFPDSPDLQRLLTEFRKWME